MSDTPQPMSEYELSELRHALRTPLNDILGYSAMLLEDSEADGSGHMAEQLRTIHSSAQHVLGLIQTRLLPPFRSGEESALRDLRSDIEAPLQTILQAIRAVAQDGASSTLTDVLRISSAAADLLAFAHGKALRETREARPVVPHEPSMHGLSSGNLLVVDDNEGNRDILTRQLERQGYRVTTVEDGTESLALMSRQPFDLVLLDIMMPGIDGVEVFQRMKANPELAELPVILISALDELSSAAYCIEHGAEDYLLKPFEPVLLRARITATLERKRLRDAERERTRQLELMSEQLQQSNEDLKRFAYAASHDLQTPLRNITSHVQLLTRKLKGKLDSGEQELASFIVDAAKRMSELVTGLLAYSQVSTSVETIELVDCAALIDDIAADLGPLIEETHAEIVCEPLPNIRANPVQLRQLFQNLIANAIKYRGAEPPRVRISSMEEPGQWHLQVHDNGLGIDPKFADSIFEMFKRLHTKDVAGTGIGLAICKRAVERMGGRIWVESEPGRGSSFHFTVPIKLVEANS